MSDLIDRQKALDGLKYEMKYGAEIDRCGLDTAYDIIADMDEANKLAAQSFVMEYDNPPLTWDELREMEGKPVWIWISPRVKNTPGSGHWAIVYRFNPIGGNKNLFEMQMENGSRYKRKYQGDLWQAYRKERK